jgi:hypothetical protein
VTYGKLSVTRNFDFVAGGFSKNLGLEYVHNFGVMVGIRLVSAIPTIEFLQWTENGLADLYERWTDPFASAQSIPAGDTARGPGPTKDVSSTSGADIWDANYDGIYTCDEWKSYLDRLFTLADRNRDGHLDPSEFTIIRQAGTSFTDADFGYFDENQDGKITRSEFVDNWKGNRIGQIEARQQKGYDK